MLLAPEEATAYTLQNASNVTLVSADGTTIQVSGKVVLAASAAPDAVTTSVSDAAAVNYTIRRRQKVNAFGETIQEIDANDRVTDFAYNTLGKLTQKQDPQTSVTLANGFVKQQRPTTKYYYDALGRLVGSDDANGNRNTRLLAAGVSVGQLDDSGQAEALVYKEFHADGGVVENGYDVFGLKRFTLDELSRRSDYTYDAADRLIQVQRAARNGGTYNAKRATDTYAWDAAGNRIRHSASPDGTTSLTDKTYYDALGRITQGVSAQGRTTTITYAWDAGLAGAGGATVGGWRTTTRNALTGTRQSAADTSTAPTTISAVVDAVNLFGQTVSHTDLGARVYTYTYNQAGWLVGQSSTGGQSISYEYYANGYIKKATDNVTGTWSEYGYDKVGNRTYEAYSRLVSTGTSSNRVYEQNAKISYDELNRVIRIDDLKADIRYEYDAQSNRRRVWSVYQDGVYGYESTQEYWYTYDSMNRFVVTRGSLGARASTEAGTATAATTIAASGVDGVKVAYDKAGQRIQAIYGYDGHREDYTYTSDGLVENTYINGNATAQGPLRAARTNDLMGRVVGYTEYDASGSAVTRSRTTTYDADNRQTAQSETYQGTTTTTTNTLLADGTLSQVASTTNGNGSSTTTSSHYAYEWWDSAKQSRITTQAYNPAVGLPPGAWGKGVSHYTYDVNGHVSQAIDELGGQSFTYISNAQGQVLLREQRDRGSVKQTHRYYYAEGRAVGDVGNDGDTAVDYATQLAQGNSGTGNTYTERQNAYKNWRPVSSADFDQNYQAITASYPGTAPGSYVVQAGDTLYAIASSQWGDASLWYLIAEANGLSGATSLTPGQTLSIPNKVTNVHNSSATSGVYDPGKTMGDTSPTILMPHPPQQDKGGCGGIGTILVIIVAVVVTVYTAGAAAGWMGAAGSAATGTASTMGLGASVLAGTATTTAAAAGFTTASMLTAAAIGGAVASIASQGVAMAMGMQDGFSWKNVATSALGAGVASGVGAYATNGLSAAEIAARPVTWSEAALRAGGASVATQGVGAMLGMSSFSWKGVAAAAAGAGASSALAQTQWMQSAASTFGAQGGRIFAGTAAGLVNGGVQAGIFETRPNWGSIAAQSFGSALGDSFAQQKVAADAKQGSVSTSSSESAKPDYYLTREQELSLQEGRTQTDYGDDYADGDGLTASPVGGVRRASRDRLEMRGANPEAEASIIRQRELRDLQRRADALEDTNKQLQALREEVFRPSGASNAAVAGTGLTISTDFPFPAEQLPEGGFFRGLVAGQRSVLDGQSSFAENVGAGLRGVALSPINTLTGLMSEVGSQYKDMYKLLTGAGASYTPSSALATSLQREGAGNTLLNMGAAALGAPVAPLFDLLEGRYEQAGAGLTGTLAAGLGVVRGVGVRLGRDGPFSPIAPGGGLMAHELAGGHLLQKHVAQTEQQLVVRLRQEPHITGSSSFYDRPTAEASVAAAVDARQNEIGAWLATSKPQFKVEYTLQDPVGISVVQGASKASDVTGLRLILRRDNTLPTGYRIHTGFPIQ